MYRKRPKSWRCVCTYNIDTPNYHKVPTFPTGWGLCNVDVLMYNPDVIVVDLFLCMVMFVVVYFLKVCIHPGEWYFCIPQLVPVLDPPPILFFFCCRLHAFSSCLSSMCVSATCLPCLRSLRSKASFIDAVHSVTTYLRCDNPCVFKHWPQLSHPPTWLSSLVALVSGLPGAWCVSWRSHSRYRGLKNLIE